MLKTVPCALSALLFFLGVSVVSASPAALQRGPQAQEHSQQRGKQKLQPWVGQSQQGANRDRGRAAKDQQAKDKAAKVKQAKGAKAGQAQAEAARALQNQVDQVRPAHPRAAQLKRALATTAEAAELEHAQAMEALESRSGTTNSPGWIDRRAASSLLRRRSFAIERRVDALRKAIRTGCVPIGPRARGKLRSERLAESRKARKSLAASRLGASARAGRGGPGASESKARSGKARSKGRPSRADKQRGKRSQAKGKSKRGKRSGRKSRSGRRGKRR